MVTESCKTEEHLPKEHFMLLFHFLDLFVVGTDLHWEEMSGSSRQLQQMMHQSRVSLSLHEQLASIFIVLLESFSGDRLEHFFFFLFYLLL